MPPSEPAVYFARFRRRMRARFGENWGWLAALLILVPLGLLVYVRSGDEEPAGPTIVFNSSTTTDRTATGTGVPAAIDGLAADAVAARVESELGTPCGEPTPSVNSVGAAVLVRTCTGGAGTPTTTVLGLTSDDVTAIQIDAPPGPAADALSVFDCFADLAIGGAAPAELTTWLEMAVPSVGAVPAATVIAGTSYELSFVDDHYRLVIGTP